MEPGRTFEVRVAREGSLVNLAFLSEGEERVTAKWQRFESQPPKHRSDLALVTAGKSGEFHCIPSCVTMGDANPEGLHLRAEYFLDPTLRRASRFWANLPTEVRGRFRDMLRMFQGAA